MEQQRKVLTAAELDSMTPDERSAVFEQRLVTDLGSVPESFKDRVTATAERLGQERRAAPRE